jgi:hypothetical protein
VTVKMTQNLAIVNLSSENSTTPIINGNQFTALLQPPLRNCKYYQVLTAEIPFSYYVVNAYNNQFQLIDSGVTSLIQIPFGNYTVQNLGTQIAALMSAATGHTYTMAIVDPVNDVYGVRGRYSINVTPNTTVFSINATQSVVNNSAYQIIGASGYTSSGTSSGGELLLPFVANVTGDQYVYVCSTQLSSGYNYSNNNTSDVLVKVPVTVSAGDTIFYQQRLASEWTEFCLNRQVDYSNLTFYLQDSAGNPVNLNGVHWSLTVAFRREIY